jgi:hypothetical protein
MIHKHIEKFLILAQQIEEVGVEESHKFWQVRNHPTYEWSDCNINNTLFISYLEYRLKPKTRTINGMEYPEPLWEKPKEDSHVYLINIDDYDRTNSYYIHEMAYTNGIVQATEEGAKQMLAALQNALSGDRKND